MNRNKYFIAGAAVAIGVLVVYFAVSGFPPTGEVAGTMVAADTSIAGVEQAERYRAGAISEEDVELDDQTINDLLQDPNVVAVLQDEDFRNALSEGALTEAFAEARFERLITSGMVREAMASDPMFRTALLENNLREYFSKENGLSRFEHVDYLREALTNERMENILRSNSLRNFLAKAPEQRLDMRMEQALAVPNFRSLFVSGRLQNELMRNQHFMDQLREARPSPRL